MNYLQQELYELVKTDAQVFDFIQNVSLDGFWYWDIENEEKGWVNASFWKTLGYDPAEAPHLASVLQDIVHPDDLALARRDIALHIADPQIPYDQIIRYTHKNGSTVYIRCRGLAIRDEHGVAKKLLGTHVDVTKDKRKEILLEEVNRVARIGGWEVLVDEQKVWWSDMTKEIHGVPLDYEPVLENGLNFYKEGHSRSTITRCVKESIQNGTPFDEELQLVSLNGREIWVRTIGQVDRSNGKTWRIYGVFLDIDKRKRNENQLLNYHILKAKAREMEQFAYAASHDLREPLLTIQGYIEVLEEDHGEELSSVTKNYLRIIREAAGRMDQLIHGMLDYSRLSKLKNLQQVNLREVMDTLMTDLSASISEKNALITIDELPTIMAYPLEIKVLLQNLLSNALKFTTPGQQPKIRIGYRKLEDAHEISVHDNGIGIAEKDHDKVFQLFRRLHASKHYSGMGIGLANVKKIAELHNGSVRITDNEAGGTSVYLLINPK